MEKLKRWVDNNLQGDRVIWAVVLMLFGISILVVYSSIGTLAYRRMESPETYLLKHTMMIVLSLIAMWVAHRIDYRYYARLALLGLWISIPLLLYTYKFGDTINDAARWITIPIINQSFQPSDFASLMLVINLAGMLARRQESIDQVEGTLFPVVS